MKKTITTILGLIVLVTLSNLELNAQVTIGKAKKPMTGALLELSNAESDELNSTKGLMLPRVIIEDRNELAIGKAGESISYDPDTHVGLVVYSTGTSYHKCKPETTQQGPYVWDGKQWAAVGDFEKEEVDLSLATGVGILKDDRNPGKIEHYLYGTFGNDLWMLENMRANSYVEPALPTEVSNKLESEARAADGLVLEPVSYTWIYPTIDEDGKNPENFIKDKSLGYLYTLYGATRTAEPEDEGAINTYHVRGICPEGWTIPTEQNVIDLETELMNNFQKYSDWTTPPANASYVVAPVCGMAGAAGDNESGSLIREKGGFYIQYTGFRGNESDEHRRYGEHGGFWLSEQFKDANKAKRYTTSGNIANVIVTQHCYYPVRCVKVGGATP